MRRFLILTVTGILAAALLGPVPGASAVVAPVADEGTGSDNMSHVANLQFETRYGQSVSHGTDIEFATLPVRQKGKKKKVTRDFAFAGTYRNGLQIIDITNPRKPKTAAVWDCAIAQGDVQVFKRGKRTLVAYTADWIPSETISTSGCYTELGLGPMSETPYGTFIADVTNPYKPKAVSFVPVDVGSHNQTVHPSGRYFYNSNSELTPVGDYIGRIEVFDLTQLRKPKLVAELDLGAGLNSHDITFNSDGTRAYSAALTHTLVMDTSDPATPLIIGRILDPTVNIHHQSDPITVDDPLLGERTFLVVTDELAGAAGNGFCPGGGLHVYDITGDLEKTPAKVGFWAIPETRPQGLGQGETLRCTSHVLRMYPKQKLMTIAWYGAGVRVLDLSGLAGVSAGVPAGEQVAGMKEIGYFYFPDSDTWSVKAHRFAKNGSFFMFANDVARGLDVFRFDASGSPSDDPGRWMSPAEVGSYLAGVAAEIAGSGAAPRSAPFCLLPTASASAAAPGLEVPGIDRPAFTFD